MKSKQPEMFELYEKDNKYGLRINGEYLAFIYGTHGISIEIAIDYIIKELQKNETYNQIWIKYFVKYHPEKIKEFIK